MKNILLLGLMLFSSIVMLAQSDMEFAEYYYNSGEFEQAKLYYERIYKNDTSNRVYERYLKTLIALEEYEEAEKIAKKKLKRTSDKAIGHLELGELYIKMGRLEDADEEYNSAIKELKPGRGQGVRLGSRFVKLNEFDYALKTYEKARKIGTDGYEFHYEMANLQGAMGNTDGMVDSFLELLNVSPNYIQTVQNSLNRNLNVVENEENAEMLKTKLLKKVQSDPDVAIYSELLIWLFTQKKDFYSAFIQAKSLDKKQKENGIRIFTLSELSMKNEDFETAILGYDYLIEKGPLGDYYISAVTNKLKAMKKEILRNPGFPRSKMEELAAEYEATIANLGVDASTAPLLRELAHIKGFYLNETDAAIELLYDATEIPGLYENTKALCKLELGDILLLKNEIWDASLLYSQVELDFKDDALGHEAKLRNAKIHYYIGDFEWAQTQLDVLKASTSKLISNDAIDLSLLITDNYNMDTTTVPMEMFAQAELLTYQGYDEMAFLKLDSITDIWQGHSLTDDIYMLKGNIYFENGNYEKAREMYQFVYEVFSIDINGDNALFNLAELNHYIFNDLVTAQSQYEKLLTEFPASLFVIESRKRFRELRGDSIN